MIKSRLSDGIWGKWLAEKVEIFRFFKPGNLTNMLRSR